MIESKNISSDCIVPLLFNKHPQIAEMLLQHMSYEELNRIDSFEQATTLDTVMNVRVLRPYVDLLRKYGAKTAEEVRAEKGSLETSLTMRSSSEKPQVRSSKLAKTDITSLRRRLKTAKEVSAEGN